MTDSRLSQRLKGTGRQDRASEDAARSAPEDRFPSAQERRRAWSEEWTQSALPKLPALEGWHLCWLSTTNSYDSIDKRMRLGYVPVKADEFPGFDKFRVKAGEHEGFISCNEMLLFKIPMDMYQEAMAYMHLELPSQEAEKMRIQAEQLQGNQGRDSAGKPLLKVEGEGYGQIDKQPNGAPIFAG